MKVRVQLRFQQPPYAHWVLLLRAENAHVVVTVKEMYPTWRNPKTPPRPRHTVPAVLQLKLVARAALALL